MIPPGLTDVTVTRRSAVIVAVALVVAATVGPELATIYWISTAGAGLGEYVPTDCGAEARELVLTTDTDGEPDRTRAIPEERYRRIQVFSSVESRELQREYDGLDGLQSIGLTQRSPIPCDLALVFYVDELGVDHPAAVDGVPVVYRYRPTGEPP